MNREQTDKCASCTEYPLADAVESGRATCAMFDEPRAWDSGAWDSGACIHYSRASDVEQRRVLVKQLVKAKL